MADEILVKEDLTRVGCVGGEVAAQESAISTDSGVVGVVCKHVDVGGTSSVVAREYGLELSYTVDIGLLNAAEESRFEVGCIVAVSIALSSDATVHSGGVTVPDVHEYSWDRETGGSVNQLDVQVERDTNLVFAYVAADHFAIDVVGALGDFRLEKAGGVIGEQESLVRTECDIGA